MNICVFSSSSNAIPEKYFDEGRILGRLIGEQGHSLVNGGANVGLMETVSKAAADAGAKTIGVIPGKFVKRALASDNSHELITTNDMKERKAKMRKISDAFIALPGGFGTIDEIMEVITLKQLNYHSKPIVFINTDNFYFNLFRQFDVFFDQNFIKPVNRNLYFEAENSFEALDLIKHYKPVIFDTKWFEVPLK
jgi:cytokinin riboside 5'-monophosphate phosphoribohydrolase